MTRGSVALLVALATTCSCGGSRASVGRRTEPSLAAVAAPGPADASIARAETLDSATPFAPCADVGDRACMAAGVAQFGWAAGVDRFEERPPRGARLRAFAVDRREVRAADYAGCVREGRCREAHCDDVGTVDPSGPAACVAWQDARAYCEARGGRLPTEAEWERVAAGLLPSHRAYPWGDDAGLTADGAATAADQTPDGVLALGGSVAEWVEDVGAFYVLPVRRDAGVGDGAIVDDAGSEAGAAPADTSDHELAGVTPVELTDGGMPIVDDPRGPREGTWRIVRGGNVGFDGTNQSSTRRRFRLPTDRRAWIGFRCVYDATTTPR